MSDKKDISRRAMLARLGLTASAIYTIPAVTTLSAARASGGSGGSDGGGSDGSEPSTSGPSISEPSSSGPSGDDCSVNPSNPSCA